MSCYLDDQDHEIHAVEEEFDGVTRQGLLVRVGPVFDENEPRDEPGVWILYQEEHGKGPLSGPVLLTPEVWRQLNRAVERRLTKSLPLWRKVLRKL